MNIRAGYRPAAAVAGAIVLGITVGLSGQTGMQRAIQNSPREITLDFELTQGSNCNNPASNDQVTIVFSNQAAESLPPPPPALGDDVVAEFSFSARDVSRDNKISFRRRVRDRSILDARFIRLVNLNGDGWCAGQLSLSVDGRPMITKVSMADRTGPASGVQDWNRANWNKRTYWQKNLQVLLSSYGK